MLPLDAKRKTQSYSYPNEMLDIGWIAGVLRHPENGTFFIQQTASENYMIPIEFDSRKSPIPRDVQELDIVMAYCHVIGFKDGDQRTLHLRAIRFEAANMRRRTRGGRAHYCCQAGCGFQLWLSTADKQLTLEQANTLLRDRELPVMDGFYSKAIKRKFSADLSLNDDGKVTFVISKEDKATSGQGATSGEPIQCPSCHKAMRRLKGSKGHFWGCSGYSEGWRTTMDDRSAKAVPRPPRNLQILPFYEN